MKKLVSAVVMLAGSVALAAGTNVDVQSARATAMATAVTANTPEASAVFFNPAGIVNGGKSLRIQLGDSLIIPKFTFDSPEGNGTVTGAQPPFQGYATLGITNDLAVGIGVFIPYGLTLKWSPDDFVGRAYSKKSSLSTYFINPEVAYRIGILKIGAGVQVVRGTVDLSQALIFPNGEGQVEVGGGAWGVGFNIGVQAEILPGKLAIGINYRSRVKLDFNDIPAHFSNIPTEFQGNGAGQIRDMTASTSLTLPDWASIGISVQPTLDFRINADVDYFAWQEFHDLTVNFQDSSFSKSIAKRWSHTFNYHLGAEYDICPTFSVRAGVMYDPTPSPTNTLSPDLPDANRINLAVGVGYHSSGFRADLGYQYIMLHDTKSTFTGLPGTYGGHVHVIGLSLGYKIGL